VDYYILQLGSVGGIAMNTMNRVTLASLLFGVSVSSGFLCSGIDTTLTEASIAQPSLLPLCENFRAMNDAFKKEAEYVLAKLEKVSGDDHAARLSSILESHLRTVELLKYLITSCKDGCTNKIKQDQQIKDDVLKICDYLTGIMPYAGKMQDVICAVLNQEFNVSSIEELQEMAK
jgi:hypothetical protein